MHCLGTNKYADMHVDKRRKEIKCMKIGAINDITDLLKCVPKFVSLAYILYSVFRILYSVLNNIPNPRNILLRNRNSVFSQMSGGLLLLGRDRAPRPLSRQHVQVRTAQHRIIHCAIF